MGLIKLISNYIKLGHKEFWRRFKEGTEKITPTQKTKGELSGIIIIAIGIIIGLIVTPIIKISGVWYWAELILLGSLIMVLFQLMGKLQMYKIQKEQDKIMEELK